MTAPEPVVYDVRDGSYDYTLHADLRAWASDHGIDVDDTFRIEVGERVARVFQFARNDQGRAYLNETTGEAALRDPFDVPVSTPPPVPPTCGFERRAT